MERLQGEVDLLKNGIKVMSDSLEQRGYIDRVETDWWLFSEAGIGLFIGESLRELIEQCGADNSNGKDPDHVSAENQASPPSPDR